MANDDNKKIEEQKRLEEELNKQKLEALAQEKIRREEINSTLTEYTRMLGLNGEKITDQSSALETLLSLQTQIKQQLSEMDGYDTEKLERMSELFKIIESASGEYDIQNESLSKNNKLLSNQVNILSEEEKAAKKTLDNYLGIGGRVFSISDRLTEISNITKVRLSDEDLLNKKQQFAAAMYTKVVDKIAEIGTAILNKALELDDASRNLMKTAGFSYNEAVEGLMRSSAMAAAAGVPIANLSKSMAVLKENFSGYTNLTAAEKTKVDQMTAALDNMGLSAEASAAFLDTSTKSLGMSLTQSQGYLSSLKGFADQTGISMQRVSRDLASNAKELAKFGDQAGTVFKELETASKQLGIEMSRLLQITEQFVTFDNAAIAAGKLNAVLGGDFINSIDLLSASMNDPVEAMQMFRDAMDRSGQSFADMDNGMKRVVAQAMGMSVEEAGKLFAQDINTATRAMREQAATQETLNELSGQMTDLQTKLKTAFAALYPALEPIIKTLGYFVDLFTKVMVTIGEFVQKSETTQFILKALAVTVGGLATAIGILGTVLLPVIGTWFSFKMVGGSITGIFGLMKKDLLSLIGLFTGATAPVGALATETAALEAEFFAMGAAGPAAGGGAEAAGAGAATGGSSAAAGAIGFIELGAAILMIGAGIGIAAAGLALLVTSFKGLGDAAWPAAVAVIGFTVAFGLLILGLISLVSGPQAAFTAAAILVLESVGAAAVMIGLGMALAGAGIALVIGALSLLANSSAELVKAMNSITDDTLGRYTQLIFIFSSLADEIERIGDTDVLQSLAKNPITINSQALQTLEKDSATINSQALQSLEKELPTINSQTTQSLEKTPIIANSDKLEGVNTKLPSPSTTLEFQLGATTSREGAELSKEEKTIKVQIDINSPINLDGRQLGDFVTTKVQDVVFSTV